MHPLYLGKTALRLTYVILGFCCLTPSTMIAQQKCEDFSGKWSGRCHHNDNANINIPYYDIKQKDCDLSIKRGPEAQPWIIKTDAPYVTGNGNSPQGLALTAFAWNGPRNLHGTVHLGANHVPGATINGVDRYFFRKDGKNLIVSREYADDIIYHQSGREPERRTMSYVCFLTQQ